MAVIGTIESTFLRPCISKNGRWYNAENIGRAVKRMQDRLADPQGLPITMRSHHAAGDDSKELVARIANVTLDQDTSEADLSGYLIDTRAGKDIAAATEPDSDGRRVLDAVSIRGWWIGPVRTITVDGQQVETADDLEIDGVDMTASPGVEAARIRAMTRVAAETSGPQRTPITESVEVHLMPSPPDPAAPESAGTGAAKTTSVDETRAALDDTISKIREAWVSVSAWQDRVDVNLDAYGIGNEDLQAAATQLGAATAAALKVLDPDADGDLDLPGDDGMAEQACQACDAALPAGAKFCPSCGTAVDTEDDDDSSESTTEEPTVAETENKDKPATGEPTTPATENDAPEQPGEGAQTAPEGDTTPAAPVGLSDEDVTRIATQLAAQLQPATAGASAETAPEKPVATETAPGSDLLAKLTESMGALVKENFDKLAAEQAEKIDALRKDTLEAYGAPRRKGLLEAAEKEPPKPLHEMSPDELTKYAAPAWDAVFARTTS